MPSPYAEVRLLCLPEHLQWTPYWTNTALRLVIRPPVSVIPDTFTYCGLPERLGMLERFEDIPPMPRRRER